jgi:hypothetical protein
MALQEPYGNSEDFIPIYPIIQIYKHSKKVFEIIKPKSPEDILNIVKMLVSESEMKLTL